MATAEATEEVVGTGETVKILSDENVGSHLIRATTETWRATVGSMDESGNKDLAKTANAVKSMLRSSNQDPQPGAVIEIELQGGTESDAVLDAIESNLPPEVEVEHGEYNRKAQTARKTGGGNKAQAGANGAKSGKKKSTPRECACGCGEMTGGGQFRPGHDARHKGNLLRRIDEGGEDGQAALEELRKFPNLTDLDAAAARMGSAPAKKAAKAEQLAKLKADKEAAAAAKAEAVDDEEVEDEDDAESEEGAEAEGEADQS